jgi:outer membrane protein assembly factor BamA
MLFTLVILTAVSTTSIAAQAPEPANRPAALEQTGKPTTAEGAAGQPQSTTRQGAIEQEQAAKAKALHPYTVNKAERIFQRVDTILEGGTIRWHPFLDSAYRGGGFTLGAGHASYVSGYNYIDARASYSIKGYKRAEVEFLAPRLFNRRAHLSLLGGWRDATQVGFYGLGMNTSKDDRTNYRFQQPYGSAVFTLFPARKILMLRGGAELTQWSLKSGQGSFPSVEEIYTPATLPGLGAEVTYLHTQGSVGLDSRTSPDYTRRGVFLGATLHDYHDRDRDFGFQMAEYEGIAHLPILRETWVLSFRARVQSAFDKDGQQIPFFMLPSVGGGSSLRGYSSWRFRDLNSLLLQGEWRIMVNRYLDLALFYDAGKVTARTSDLDLDGLKDDFGLGFRFHGPFVTPLRIEFARSRESSLSFIFSTGASF